MLGNTAARDQLAPCSPPAGDTFSAPSVCCADILHVQILTDGCGAVLRDAAAVASSLQLGRQIAMSHSPVRCRQLTNDQADEWTSINYNPYNYLLTDKIRSQEIVASLDTTAVISTLLDASLLVVYLIFSLFAHSRVFLVP